MQSINIHSHNNQNNLKLSSKTNLGFKGIKTASLPILKNVIHSSSVEFDNIFSNLQKNLSKSSPDFVKLSGEDIIYQKSQPLLETLTYPFTKMPKDILHYFAEKFNIEKILNSEMMQKHISQKETEKNQRALRGYIESINDSINKSNFKEFKSAYYKNIDKNFAPDTAKYHTPHERTITRITSGTTAAIMLGNDFYNNSLLNGTTEEEAKKEADIKRKQELIATAQEAAAQYLMLGAFSKIVNGSNWGAPVLNTLLGIVFHITSRLSTGRPLTRIKKLPDKPVNKTMEEYIDQIKNQIEPESKNNKPKNKKQHILSLKNIALACFGSILAGFLGRSIKSTQIFNNLKNKIVNTNITKSINKALYDYTTGEVSVTKGEYTDFIDTLRKCGKQDMSNYYKKVLKKFDNKNINDKVLLGTYEKMFKTPIGEVSKKEILSVPLMPVRIITEFVSFPYKAVLKILEGIKILPEPKEKGYKNDYNVLNIYRKYQEELAKNKNIANSDFIENFKKILDENILSSLNKETKSSVKNAAIAKTTQLLSTFSSIYFAMTDDYNRSFKQTHNKEKAEKEARLRGVNKAIRIATQITFLQINNIFKIPYAASIIGAGLITVACTVATDSVSRLLSGMSTGKKTKEQLEKYDEHKKNGLLKKYYSALDKLTE